MSTLVATPGAANANSFLTEAEGEEYWSSRSSELWEDADDPEQLLINATRAIVNALSPRREYFPPTTGVNARGAFYYVHPTWTGTIATATQRLPWGRIGMLDRNGNAIATGVIPLDLKEATAELAGQMSTSDRMIDSSTAAKGIKSLKAGPVDITYVDGVPILRLLPSVIWSMLVPSWLTSGSVEPALRAFIEVASD